MLIFQGVLKFMATPWCITFSPVFSREKSRHWVAVVVWSKSRMDLRWGRNHFSGGLVGGFKHFLCSPLPGEMIQFDSSFSNGLKPSPSGLFWKKGRNFGLSIWYPPIGTLQGTITYPTKGAKEIIDSLVPWDGICYRKGESLPFPSFFRVYVELRGCIYIYIYIVFLFLHLLTTVMLLNHLLMMGWTLSLKTCCQINLRCWHICWQSCSNWAFSLQMKNPGNPGVLACFLQRQTKSNHF